MNVIYKPKGRALEYSPWACNLYIGCVHGCRYCYAPGCVRRKADRYHTEVTARKDVVAMFEKDARYLVEKYPDDDSRRVLFCFLSDPYQPLEQELRLTRSCLEVAKKTGLKVDILTKGAYKYVSKDLQLIKDAGARLGVTLSFVDDAKRKEWERDAASVSDRMRLLKKAHSMGIYTWVSMEPVIDTDDALAVIDKMHDYVDFWKVGKLNYFKEVDSTTDWRKFYYDVISRLKRYECAYYIKNSLKKFARKKVTTKAL